MGEISDGYGEGSVEDVLAEHEEWVISRSLQLCTSPTALAKIEDVRQEGRITLWESLRAGLTAREAVGRAFNRMKSVAWQDRLWTGQEKRDAHTVGPGSGRHRTASTGADSIDAMVESGVWDSYAASISGALGDVEMAYHHGEIMQALNALSIEHREYMYWKFWRGWTDSEISRFTGISTSGVNNRWVRTIRPALLTSLDHLRAA